MTLKRFDRKYWPSLVLTLMCLTVSFLGRDVRDSMAVSYDSWHNVLLYHFAHANIFHLICNLMALWPFAPRIRTVIVAYACSSFSALLLAFTVPGYGPVCGLSAMLFACFARRYATWQKPTWQILLVNLPFLFIPQVDALLHLLSFYTSYLIWKAAATYSGKQPS